MSKEIRVPKGRVIVCLRACDNNFKRALMLRRIGACLGKVRATEARSVSMSSRTEPGLEGTHGKQSILIKETSGFIRVLMGFLPRKVSLFRRCVWMR